MAVSHLANTIIFIVFIACVMYSFNHKKMSSRWQCHECQAFSSFTDARGTWQDKNPVLTEFATEVSKIINTAVKSMEVEVEKKEKKETETPTNPTNCTPSQKKQATETC
jgi:hypothetical protein